MKRYVFPPKFDFLTFDEGELGSVDPIKMYIFEFKHTLKQKDLSDIWQNLPPDIALDVKEPKETTSVVSHAWSEDEFPAMTKDLRWMVFKVKQKAANSYYKMLHDSIGGIDAVRSSQELIELSAKRNKEKPAYLYNYNWPYDYFSLVEMAKIDAGITVEPEDFEIDVEKVVSLSKLTNALFNLVQEEE